MRGGDRVARALSAGRRFTPVTPSSCSAPEGYRSSRFNLCARAGTSDRHVLDGREAERVIALGASDAINYRRTPDWEKEVRASAGGAGSTAWLKSAAAARLRGLQALGRARSV